MNDPRPTYWALSDMNRIGCFGKHDALETAARMDRANMTGVRIARSCPGLPGVPVCGEPAEQGDRYCAGCRAEFAEQPAEVA